MRICRGKFCKHVYEITICGTNSKIRMLSQKFNCSYWVHSSSIRPYTKFKITPTPPNIPERKKKVRDKNEHQRNVNDRQARVSRFNPEKENPPLSVLLHVERITWLRDDEEFASDAQAGSKWNSITSLWRQNRPFSFTRSQQDTSATVFYSIFRRWIRYFLAERTRSRPWCDPNQRAFISACPVDPPSRFNRSFGRPRSTARVSDLLSMLRNWQSLLQTSRRTLERSRHSPANDSQLQTL